MKRIALVILTALLIAPAANALTITATEVLEDIPPYESTRRNLRRTISDSTGFSQVENDDAVIVVSNSVDNDFGIENNDDVTYRHNLTWLNPAPASLITASLKIDAFGVDGGNDVVFADSINLGTLNNDGSLIFDGFTTTLFGSLSPVTLSAIFVDGYLNIFIDKNSGANRFGRLDTLSVYKSTLEVQYEAVPEPATVLLLGSGLAGIAARRKMKRA